MKALPWILAGGIGYWAYSFVKGMPTPNPTPAYLRQEHATRPPAVVNHVGVQRAPSGRSAFLPSAMAGVL